MGNIRQLLLELLDRVNQLEISVYAGAHGQHGGHHGQHGHGSGTHGY